MVKKLDLDEKQLATLNNLVEEFNRTLGVPESTQNPSDAWRIELRRLRGEMIEAEKQGDLDASVSLRPERTKRILQLPQGSSPTTTLIQSIDDVLHETQRRGLRRILQRTRPHLDRDPAPKRPDDDPSRGQRPFAEPIARSANGPPKDCSRGKSVHSERTVRPGGHARRRTGNPRSNNQRNDFPSGGEVSSPSER